MLTLDLWDRSSRFSLWELMWKFSSGAFFESLRGLSEFGVLPHDPFQSLYLQTTHHEALKHNIVGICDVLAEFGLTTSLASAQRMRKILFDEVETTPENDWPPPAGNWVLLAPEAKGRLKFAAEELSGRIRDDLNGRVVLMLTTAQASYYEPADPLFGKEVFGAFPSANEDIAEAAACLAFGRNTACIMHLMRAAEVALTALAKTLDIKKQKDWGSYLREIDRELERRVKTSGARTVEEQFYSEAAIGFDHLKRAWRNPTMHIDRTYSGERAVEIFQAVKSFMRHLASRVSESP